MRHMRMDWLTGQSLACSDGRKVLHMAGIGKDNDYRNDVWCSALPNSIVIWPVPFMKE